jgi:hypothetical protein
MKKEKHYKHPSYGMVSFSHRSGNPKLFHSALENHSNYITLAIKTCTLVRSDTGDRLYGPVRGDLIEVDLSASQFTELLTTMNIGLGVACTINTFNNKAVPPPPDIDSQSESLKTEFRERVKDFADDILKDTKEVGDLLNKPSLNKADRSKILGILTRVSQELKQNIPFFLEVYEEATDKVVDAAKAEIEGFMVSAVRQAGLAALAAGKVDITPPQLPAIKTEE